MFFGQIVKWKESTSQQMTVGGSQFSQWDGVVFLHATGGKEKEAMQMNNPTG